MKVINIITIDVHSRDVVQNFVSLRINLSPGNLSLNLSGQLIKTMTSQLVNFAGSLGRLITLNTNAS